jgi:hypothetical protein
VRAEAVAAVSACCGPAFWDAIRRHERLTAPAARAVLERLVGAALSSS